MGLDDRDYMRERNRRNFNRTLGQREGPFTPPQKDLPLWVMALCWILMGLVVYKGYGWLQEKKTHRRPPMVQSQSEAKPAGERQAPAPERQAAPTSVAARTPVYTPQPPQQIPEAVRPQTGGTIYLCRDYNGGTFWASNHCNQHRAHIDRMVSVPPGMPFEQQVQLAEQRRQALTSTTTSYQISSAPPSNQVSNNKALCESLDGRVTQLDAMARQPQSGTTQDWIRTERQKTRDEQFRLRC